MTRFVEASSGVRSELLGSQLAHALVALGVQVSELLSGKRLRHRDRLLAQS